ncbi:unnamed protein product, partial [Iphiclides podalirius]
MQHHECQSNLNVALCTPVRRGGDIVRGGERPPPARPPPSPPPPPAPPPSARRRAAAMVSNSVCARKTITLYTRSCQRPGKDNGFELAIAGAYATCSISYWRLATLTPSAFLNFSHSAAKSGFEDLRAAVAAFDPESATSFGLQD